MAKGKSGQDHFLNTLRQQGASVSIYLVNGIKLQGHIKSFDQFTVVLKNTVSQVVYKHAISTVVPSRHVPHNNNNPSGGSSNYHHGSTPASQPSQPERDDAE